MWKNPGFKLFYRLPPSFLLTYFCHRVQGGLRFEEASRIEAFLTGIHRLSIRGHVQGLARAEFGFAVVRGHMKDNPVNSALCCSSVPDRSLMVLLKPLNDRLTLYLEYFHLRTDHLFDWRR